MTDPTRRAFTFDLASGIADAAEEYAARMGLTLAELVTLALIQYTEGHATKPRKAKNGQGAAVAERWGEFQATGAKAWTWTVFPKAAPRHACKVNEIVKAAAKDWDQVGAAWVDFLRAHVTCPMSCYSRQSPWASFASVLPALLSGTAYNPHERMVGTAPRPSTTQTRPAQASFLDKSQPAESDAEEEIDMADEPQPEADQTLATDAGSCVELRALWLRVKEALELELPPEQIETFINKCRPYRSEDGGDTLALTAPDRFHRGWIASNFGPAIERALENAVGRPVRLRVRIPGEKYVFPS